MHGIFEAVLVAAAFVTPWQDPVETAGGDPALGKLVVLSDAKVKELLDAGKQSDKLKALVRERHQAACSELKARYQEFLNGRGTLDFLIAASQNVLRAELDLSAEKKNQLAVRENHLGLLKQVESTNQERFDAGRIAIQDLNQVKFFRLDAEIELERLKNAK
jgi:G:T/U-mismatch repair DNA glycosylase